MDDDCWTQLLIAWADWDAAEDTAARELYPTLAAAEHDGLLDRWFFMRKRPCWRLRYTGGPETRTDLEQRLEQLTTNGQVTCWTHGIYEPETLAFGGPAAMEAAHTLFAADSRNVLAYFARQHSTSDGLSELGRRELGVLLISVLLRSASLDWYEQGDVWDRVAGLRRTAAHTPTSDQYRHQVYRLMTADAVRLAASGPLAPIRDWIDAFAAAGGALAELARHGQLDRGLRAVLAHHAIFIWNRLGLSAQDQKTLSEQATEVVMTDPTTDTPWATDAEAARLRHALADQLRDQGRVTDERIDAAVRAVPRHVFVPGSPLEEAYANSAVYTKHDDGHVALSAASQPGIVTMQLDQLAVDKGQHVLELGAGTGYNAALLAHLVGDGGHVTTVDVDDDLVTGARSHLAEAGVTNVDVICGDGALGYPDNAAYDRIVATVSTADLPAAWLEQAAEGGRLVVPLRIAGSATRSIAFERHGDSWTSVDSQLCAFMGLRDSAAGDPRRLVDLTGDSQVVLHAYREQDVDADAVHGVLDTPAYEAWSGVQFVKAEPLDPVWLWLACHLPSSISRMETQPNARDAGLVTPMLPWGSMATVDGESLAYLTTRATEDSHEMGAIGHGPTGQALAERMTREITAWTEYRTTPITVTFHPDGTSTEPEPAGNGQVVIPRPSGHVTVTWQA